MLIDNADVSRDALRGKVAVVTGAGRGIGRETARVLAHLGAAVVIAEIDPVGREAESAIRAEGGQALYVQTDISDPAAVDELHRRAHAAFGPAHILVNNAEVFEARPLLEHTLEQWERVFAVNLRGAFLCIKAFLPEMLAAASAGRDGAIVTMSSSDGMPYLSAYLASKVGLSSLARSLAGEVGPSSGVSVYCCGPGMVDTPGIRAAVPLLAPLYGLSSNEFIRQSAPGGELWSADAAATGLVGSLLHAAKFHGQDIDSFVGLQQLGLDSHGQRIVGRQTLKVSQTPASNEQQDRPSDVAPLAVIGRRGGSESRPYPGPGIANRDREHEASSATVKVLDGAPAAPPANGHDSPAALNRQIEAMLRDNVREYEQLSAFQRPFVRRMFQQGTGLKVEDWLAAAEGMTAQLEAGQADAATRAAYCAQLTRLGKFLVKQESDARGYFTDPARLTAALDGLHDRQARVKRMVAALAGEPIGVT